MTMRRLAILLPGLLVFMLWSMQAACLAGEAATVATTEQCAAATPVENPWTKRLPAGWWQKRHEEILSAPGRKEAQIVFIGDSITDGWDSEGGGLKIWEKEYVPMSDQVFSGVFASAGDRAEHGRRTVRRAPYSHHAVSPFRNGWGREYPWANLFNKDGMPALPLRTDAW